MRTSYAVCINNRGYPASLEMLKVYRVLPDREAKRHGQIRVIDESGEDYLYAADRFAPLAIPPVVRKVFAARLPAECVKVLLLCVSAILAGAGGEAFAGQTWSATAANERDCAVTLSVLDSRP